MRAVVSDSAAMWVNEWVCRYVMCETGARSLREVSCSCDRASEWLSDKSAHNILSKRFDFSTTEAVVQWWWWCDYYIGLES